MRDTSERPPSVELMVVPDCPNTAPAQAQLRAILDELGLTGMRVQTTVIRSDHEAVARGDTRSPSLRIKSLRSTTTASSPAA